MTGKAIIPIIAQGGDEYKVTLLEQVSMLHGKEEVDKMVQTIQNRGYYPYVTNPDEVQAIISSPSKMDELFMDQVIKTIQRWMDYADAKLSGTGIRCIVCPGNDDVFEIDDVIAASKCVRSLEGQVIELDEYHEMANSGWSNPTPWNTHREEPDEALLKRLDAVISQLKNPSLAVFNFHAPPYGSGLDEAPELTKDLRQAYAGRSMIPVGSKAVMSMIDKYQPLLGLHGHIHESKGTRKYKKTLCVNPGSMYEQGMLTGAVIELKPHKVGNYLLTTG
jgi:Icc-related predicted phosphoesterase